MDRGAPVIRERNREVTEEKVIQMSEFLLRRSTCRISRSQMTALRRQENKREMAAQLSRFITLNRKRVLNGKKE